MQRDLGSVNLEEWAITNAEKVQHARDVAVVNLKACTEERKKRWDKRAQTRSFKKGDQVFLRKSGLNTKLANSWEGSMVVEKRNIPLSYRITWETEFCHLSTYSN